MSGIDRQFFSAPLPGKTPETGDILVANPFLSEKWFDRSVIALVDHVGGEGSMGVVMNLAIENPLQELTDGVTLEEDVAVFCGGPLSHDKLYFMHSLGDSVIPGGTRVGKNMWLGGDFKTAIEYVNSGYPLEGNLRFFIGYSSWGPGQLEEELDSRTWAVAGESSLKVDFLRNQGISYWYEVVRELGPDYRPWLMLPHDLHKN